MIDNENADEAHDDDNDDDDGDDHESFCKDSELGQLLMTCGKLSNQAPAVNNSLSGSD